MRTASFLALALATALAGGAAAQPGPRQLTPFEQYERFRATMNEGQYDIAGLFLDEFLKSVPTAEALAQPNEKAGTKVFEDIEKKYGTTAFSSLRQVPKFSDDPATEKRIRASIEDANKRARAVADKFLRNPERVAKYVRNLGETYEERVYAQQELKRTGEFAVPFLIDALRKNPSQEQYAGILDTVTVLDREVMPGFVAALETLPSAYQAGVLVKLASRRDALALPNAAQTDITPYLYRVLSKPPRAEDGRTLYDAAVQLHNQLIPGPKADARDPVAELTALARTFHDHKGRYLGAATDANGPTRVPVWVTTDKGGVTGVQKLSDVPVGQAEEYYGLKYARWALEARPDYQPAQALILALAAERAVERARYANLAVAEPAVYKLLADAPSQALLDLLAKGMAEKRTALVFAAVQVLGDRADRAAATPPAGAARPAPLVKALTYPDHAVQFAAATALLRSPVPVPPEAKPLIVDILIRAAGTDLGKPGESKGTALLVDPRKFSADANAALLRRFGYDVEILATGRDLLRRVARASDFDLIFIDHHTGNPELINLVAQVTADPRTAGRPVYVIASPDKPIPPTFDQLLVRTMALIAATEGQDVAMPPPFAPDPRTRPEELTNLPQLRKESQALRDKVFQAAATARVARLLRVIDALPITLTPDQRRVLDLRAEVIAYAVLAAEFPLTLESSPETFAHVARTRRLLDRQPPSAELKSEAAVRELIRLVDRLELDVVKAKGAQARYEMLLSRVDPGELGLAVQTFRDPAAEGRVSRALRAYPEVKVIPEPYSKGDLEPEFNILFADPMMVPREAGTKRADARLAVEFLRQMATGDRPGYDLKAAEPVLLAAVTNPIDLDVASAAIEAAERFKSGAAQAALLQLATRNVGTPPVALRRKAADAAIRHIRANGPSAPPELVAQLVRETTPEATPDAELRAKLLTLKGILAFKQNDFANDLKSYNPPIVPVPKKEPEPKKEPPQ